MRWSLNKYYTMHHNSVVIVINDIDAGHSFPLFINQGWWIFCMHVIKKCLATTILKQDRLSLSTNISSIDGCSLFGMMQIIYNSKQVLPPTPPLLHYIHTKKVQ